MNGIILPSVLAHHLIDKKKKKHQHQQRQYTNIKKKKKYAQELLSTFSLSLGEVALQPSTGGTFIVTIYHPSTHVPSSESLESSEPPSVQSTVLWNRKTDQGFPETKELKRRVRDVIEPERDLGHVDRDHRRPVAAAAATEIRTAVVEGDAKKEEEEEEEAEKKKQDSAASGAGVVCEDCN